ncbi:hypothetical protein VNO77_04334 [Canavalia gladiata]|uniref:Nucleolar protein 10-like N-terminal domain-containing protein n=1 Tax=Canavalia gladiata TaxID=3824 RepID=A0AAN9R7N6_CANGL
MVPRDWSTTASGSFWEFNFPIPIPGLEGSEILGEVRGVQLIELDSIIILKRRYSRNMLFTGINIQVGEEAWDFIASSIYPPRIKVYEVRELGWNIERHLDSEIVDFQVSTKDYSKPAFLYADRSVCLRAKYGKALHLANSQGYDCWSFSRSKLHGLVACGGEGGVMECSDMRMRSSVGRIDIVGPNGDVDHEVAASEFDEDGDLLMAVGSGAGKFLFYDPRSSHPVRIRDHVYGSSILDIKWHHTLNYEKPMLITSGNHVDRIWDPETGEGSTSIEPTTGTINDVCVFLGSGLILLALDYSQIPSYLIFVLSFFVSRPTRDSLGSHETVIHLTTTKLDAGSRCSNK